MIDKQTELYREAKRLRDEEKQELSKKSGWADGETDRTIENIVVDLEKHHISESESQDDEKSLEKRSSVRREKGKQEDIGDHPQRNTEKHGETSSSAVLRVPAKSDNDQSKKVTKLMALLDRRKHLLGKLVQDETVQTTAKLDSVKASTNRGSTNRPDDEENSDEDIDDSCIQSHSEKENKDEEKVVVQGNIAVICEKTTSEAVTEVSDTDKKRKKIKGNISTTNISYLGMICELMKEWITPETLSFVNCQGEDDEKQAGISTEMEAKIKDLCRRVDQQEATLDDIIGNHTGHRSLFCQNELKPSLRH